MTFFICKNKEKTPKKLVFVRKIYYFYKVKLEHNDCTR